MISPISTIPYALAVDSDADAAAHAARLLRKCGVERVDTACSVAAARACLARGVQLLLCEVLLGEELCYPLLCLAKSHEPPIAVVTMSDRAARSDIFQLRDYGAIAFLEKPLQQESLHNCLRQIVRGYVAGNEYKKRSERERSFSTIEDTLHRYESRYGLTTAEVQVLAYAMSGMSRDQIARERSVSLNTTKSQIRALLEKTGAQTLRDLVVTSFDELSGTENSEPDKSVR